jgi:hypothetical protein
MENSAVSKSSSEKTVKNDLPEPASTTKMPVLPKSPNEPVVKSAEKPVAPTIGKQDSMSLKNIADTAKEKEQTWLPDTGSQPVVKTTAQTQTTVKDTVVKTSQPVPAAASSVDKGKAKNDKAKPHPAKTATREPEDKTW